MDDIRHGSKKKHKGMERKYEQPSQWSEMGWTDSTGPHHDAKTKLCDSTGGTSTSDHCNDMTY